MRIGLLLFLILFLFPTLSTQAQEDTAQNNPSQKVEDSVQKKTTNKAVKLPGKHINKQTPIVPFKPTEAVPADAIIAFPTDI